MVDTKSCSGPCGERCARVLREETGVRLSQRLNIKATTKRRKQRTCIARKREETSMDESAWNRRNVKIQRFSNQSTNHWMNIIVEH